MATAGMSTTVTPPPRPRLTGLQCMALSAFFFSLMSLSVKLAGQRIPTMELVFSRAVIVSLLAWLDLRRRGVRLRGSDTRALLLRSMVGFVALTCFYYAVVRLPLAEATVIHFTNPVFTALIAAVWLGERLRPREFALALGGLLGVVVMVRPAGLFNLAGPTLPLVPVAASVTAAVLAAVAYVLVRHLRHHDAMLVVFYFAGISSLGALPLMLPAFVWPVGSEWALLGAVGVSTLLGQIFLTLGLQRERAARATTVGYVQIVFATLWGALVFAERPSLTTAIGAAIIVATTLLLARRQAPVAGAERTD